MSLLHRVWGILQKRAININANLSEHQALEYTKKRVTNYNFREKYTLEDFKFFLKTEFNQLHLLNINFNRRKEKHIWVSMNKMLTNHI